MNPEGEEIPDDKTLKQPINITEVCLYELINIAINPYLEDTKSTLKVQCSQCSNYGTMRDVCTVCKDTSIHYGELVTTGHANSEKNDESDNPSNHNQSTKDSTNEGDDGSNNGL